MAENKNYVSRFEYTRLEKSYNDLKRWVNIDSVYVETRLIELDRLLDKTLGTEEEGVK